MTDADLRQTVIRIISEQMDTPVGSIDGGTHCINDLNMDSLDTVELLMEFEDEFDIAIPDEDAEKVRTVNEIVEALKKYVEVTG